MIHSVFHLDLPVADKVLRAALIYTFLVVALRLAGKRELAQLSTIDFIVLLAVANAVQNGIQGDDLSVTGNVVSAVTLLALNAAVACLLYHSARARAVVEGTGDGPHRRRRHLRGELPPRGDQPRGSTGRHPAPGRR